MRELVSSDVLLSTLIKEAVGERTTELSDIGLSKKTGAARTLIVKPGQQGEKFFDWFKREDNIKNLLGLIKKKVGNFKQDIYVSFIDTLVDGNPVRGFDLPRTRVFCAIADQKNVVENALNVVRDKRKAAAEKAREESDDNPAGYENPDDINQSEIKDTINTFKNSLDEGNIDIDFKRCTEGLDYLRKQNEEAGAVIGLQGVEEEGDSKESDDDEKKSKKKGKNNAPSWMKNGVYKFYFVFLGDIIELACKNARIGALDLPFHEQKTIYDFSDYKKVVEQDASLSYPLVNARLLLGPLEYYGKDGNIHTINLAKMPISFAYFRAWFINKIIKRRRTQMPLGAFLSALINDLVMPALGANMPDSFQVPASRASIVGITLPGEFGDATHKICGKNVKSSKEAFPMEREVFTESADFSRNYLSKISNRRDSESLVKTSYDYLLMYVTSFKDPATRNADPAVDIKDGVYHFNIGSDMGLMRSMDFSRVQIPDLAELRSAQAEEQGIDQMEQLKIPYDTNVNLVGTSLFTPGMYYYVNPSLAGLGSVKDASSLAYQLNLGGYHLVQQVNTRITKGAFKTEIIGTQTSQGKK